MDTHSRYLRLRREDIAYFRTLMESYEGLAGVRTKDPYEAIVEVIIPPGVEGEVEKVLEDVRKEIPFEPVSCEGG